MRTAFEGVGKKEVNVKIPGNGILGPGDTGAKSAALSRLMPKLDGVSVQTEIASDKKEKKIRTYNLVYLPRMVGTPEAFGDFLRRCCASHERLDESRVAIMRTEFTQSEKGLIRDLILPFTGLYVAVRSDECTAGGVGLWHTEFMEVTRSSNAEAVVKEILASEFSRDVVAFKQRLGLPMEKTPGVMVMPVRGIVLDVDGVVTTTVLHVNAITRFVNETSLVVIGYGIGGANNEYPYSTLIYPKPDRFATQRSFILSTLIPNSHGTLVMSNSGIAPARGREKMTLETIIPPLLGLGMDGLEVLLPRVTQKVDIPLYLELGFSGEWNVLQCAETTSVNVVAPKGTEQIVLKIDAPDFIGWGQNFGIAVSGRGIVQTSQTVFLKDHNDLQKLRKINEELRGYTLVTNCDLRDIRGMLLSFADYSNAAVIISNSKNGLYSVGSHIGGAVREAGIIVLNGEMNEKFVNGLKAGVNNQTLLVYANDAKDEATVRLLSP